MGLVFLKAMDLKALVLVTGACAQSLQNQKTYKLSLEERYYILKLSKMNKIYITEKADLLVRVFYLWYLPFRSL